MSLVLPTRKDESYKYLNFSFLKDFNFKRTEEYKIKDHNDSLYDIIFDKGELLLSADLKDKLKVDIIDNNFESHEMSFFDERFRELNQSNCKKLVLNINNSFSDNLLKVNIKDSSVNFSNFEFNFDSVNNMELAIVYTDGIAESFAHNYFNFKFYGASEVSIFEYVKDKENKFLIDKEFYLYGTSQVKHTVIYKGSAWARNTSSIILDDKEVTYNGKYLCVGQGKNITDDHVELFHLAEDTNSRMVFKGALDEASKYITNGIVYIRDNAQGSDSHQISRGLLLGDKCEMNSKPELEVMADDVAAGHGAAVGYVDEERLNYLLCRGIDKDTAEKMLVSSFYNDIIQKLPSLSKSLYTTIENGGN